MSPFSPRSTAMRPSWSKATSGCRSNRSIWRRGRSRRDWSTVSASSACGQAKADAAMGAQFLGRLRAAMPVQIGGGGRDDEAERSEEHTSELQSLMRSSYAVFCLNKKTEQNGTSERHISD